jgi:DNA-binding protein H-NS
MASLQELIDQKAAIEREITEARHVSRTEAVARILADMAENGLTVDDLAKASQKGGQPRTTTRKPVAAKYRDPASGNTWTGRGLKPRWLVAAIESGKALGDFVI